ncbi:leucyl/phenylalanyl-tRNA--protein transferase [Actibacterium ureilyticum]|uniref:leucyl/phenylalanyl-tRNA--protein transferase n=1 Tax=Actibacterium ureilyticum TaxID=1590614 RepID=UPI000BAABAE1|nr:leucyl/phenylalanyl-tRNA--protein transferase [Actibacterium ureilyticum]
MRRPELTPDLLLQAYATGLFPMAQSRDDPRIHWMDPRNRGVFPLHGFHISRSLRRAMLRGDYQIRTDTAFADVVAGCASRDETWINDTIFQLYNDLHRMGVAHSLEVWSGADLIGGVYGVALGGAYFGESMFSRRTNASKIALAFLVDRLNVGGFRLFDTQYLTAHLASLGAIEVPRSTYRVNLAQALQAKADFNRQGPAPAPQDVIQRITQTS